MRLIDADALFDFLTDQLEKEVGFYSKGRNAGLNVARSALHDKTITPTISPPPNDPLTLDELREMDGEPVFIKCLFNENLSSYVVIDKDKGGIFTRLFYASFEYYGDEWLAYRHKPEEEAERDV